MATTCPSCGHATSGRFCSDCGASIGAASPCSQCGAELPVGARFCTGCGASATGGDAPPRRTARLLPWSVAGAAVLALVGVVTISQLRAPADPPPEAASFVPAEGPRGVDLSSMTPLEAADRLFDRVMRAMSTGDSAQVTAFLPMALGAYERVEELDADPRYHIAVLELLAGNPDAARAQADAILTEEPDHLFGLHVAAQAERQRGRTEEAVRLFSRFLEVYPAQIERDLPEYEAHRPALPELRAEAMTAVNG